MSMNQPTKPTDPLYVYTDAEVEFARAMDRYRRESGRQHLTSNEVLRVLRGLGYRKVVEGEGDGG